MLGMPFSGVFGQWYSESGNNPIPADLKDWALKIAPDRSVWTIAAFDNFPPANQILKVCRSVDEGVTWTGSSIDQAIYTYGWDISPVDSNIAYACLGMITRKVT